ncbi:hypothetical protein NX059_005043 [Plenodomus lindquistii]|nr:hypothetical protein NX059_005043 [Plenodomus lindquistii]
MTKFKRVAYLSSLAAVVDFSKGKRIGYTYTEQDWNPITFDEAVKLQDTEQAYIASKALAERAVWNWMKDREPVFDLVCVNPSMILGPHIQQINAISEIAPVGTPALGPR